MIESSLAADGYENSIQTTGNDRGIEYQLFAKVTRDLAQADISAPDFITKRASALHNNLRLWTKLAVDVAHQENALPKELRSSLFYLSEFTRHHTAKIYNGEADANILVELNTSIMRGLRAGANTEGARS